MADLKPYFDAVNTTEAAVQSIASELDALFIQDTEDARAQALAKKAELDEALIKHDEAVSTYESRQKANRPNTVAKNFVPVSTTQTEPAEDSQPTVIKRQDYNKLDLVERARFVKSGGSIED
jgi:ElaB/YqjD/DUF883 family membrane-anchored ribosome-binding protein